MTNVNTQSFNNLTWDTQLTPQSFGLFMRDIDEASLNLKTAIYNWNINLSADLYKELEDLSSQKYNAVNPDWSIDTTRLLDTSMTWKNPWLYMTHQNLWFWSWDEWKAFIWNTWDFFFKWDNQNYIQWNWSTLKIEWDITARNWYFTWNIISDATIKWWVIQSNDFNIYFAWWRLDNSWLQLNNWKNILCYWWWWLVSHSSDSSKLLSINNWNIVFDWVWLNPLSLYYATDWILKIDGSLFINDTREVLWVKSVISPSSSYTNNSVVKVDINWTEYWLLAYTPW